MYNHTQFGKNRFPSFKNPIPYPSLLTVLLGIVLILAGACTTEEDLESKVERIHANVLTLDTHADTPLVLARPGFDIREEHDAWKTGTQVDIPRMRKGELNGIFFIAYLGQGPRDSASHVLADEKMTEYFDIIHSTISENPNNLALATNPSDLESSAEEGKIAIYIGLENGYALGTDISKVKKYYDLGARYITLSHSRNNEICDSSTDPDGPEHGGLSAFGKEVVTEMNRLGMMIDVSHISDDAFYDVLELSTQPIVATHSSARAICDHPRNLTDDMIKKLAEKGGVVQVNALSAYVKTPEPNTEREREMELLRETYGDFQEMSPEDRDKYREEMRALREKYKEDMASVADYVDHIDHIVDLVGIEYVGIGMDLDGGGGLRDCYDISEIQNITYELVKRGYSEEDISKIWSGNFMRVFNEVMETAQEDLRIM
ncbi:dipeptidase [Pleomorphovibrio marinus]|uniref:dipeptidase n=1 Tax=Pleomorphovibrio marinus TaxID=2164132 RepID=UPI000E0A2449|nr:dipeptidase [Pleomorphovibrio marinus]